MDHTVNLRQLVTLILVDYKQVAGSYAVKFIINQKLFTAGNGVIQFTTVMDMHIHGFFFLIQVGNGERPGSDTVFYGNLTGKQFFHISSFPD